MPAPFAHTLGPHNAKLVLVGEAWGDKRIPQRIWNKIKIDANGCWIWQGSQGGSSPLGGYPETWFENRKQMTHIVMYSVLVGPYDRNLDLDHLCRVRMCCNPTHLEPVSRSENNKRGLAGMNRVLEMANTEFCPRGHKYATAFGVKAYRTCKTCKNARQRWSRAGHKGKIEDYIDLSEAL